MKKLKNGSRVTIKRNGINSGCPEGEAIIVEDNGSLYTVIMNNNRLRYSAYYAEVNLKSNTAEELQKEIETRLAEIATLEGQLKWMSETGSKVFDPEDFKIWYILEVFENASSRKEKVQAIKELLK